MAGNARRTRVFRRNFASKQKKIFRYAMLKNFNYPIMVLNVLMVFFLSVGLLEAPSLPPQLPVENVSYKIFLTGKPAVGKTSTVAKLLGQGTATIKQSFVES